MLKLIIYCVLIVLYSCQTKPENEKVKDQVNEYEMGTQYFTWVDSNRIDPYYGGNRIINVQIWYPINESKELENLNPAQYYFQIEKAWHKLDNWTKEDFEIVSNIKTKSIVNYPITDDGNQFPVLMFSPSFGGHINYYTYYAENLVRNGYIVVGVNHMYESEFVFDKNGEIIIHNSSFHDSLETLKIPEQITGDEFREQKSRRTKVLGEDLIFCIEQLGEINTTKFNGKLDLNNIGVWGHSIGGAAAIYASLLDSKIKSVVNLDGTPPSIGLKNGINVPFMFIEDLTDYKNHSGYKIQFDRRNNFCQKGNSNAYRILIGDISHNSFLDIHYHFTKNLDEKEKALKTLDTTLDYMIKFYNNILKKSSNEIHPVQSDSIEIFHFIK